MKKESQMFRFCCSCVRMSLIEEGSCYFCGSKFIIKLIKDDLHIKKGNVKKHTKVYMQFFDYGEQDFVMCEMCQQDRAVDIHHIQGRGMGGSKEKDFIENLMG